MEKSRKKRVWRLNIGERMELEAVESALREASRKDMQKAQPEGAHGMIERVDIRDGETTVFISGDESTAKALSTAFRGILPRAKVTFSTVTPARIKELS